MFSRFAAALSLVLGGLLASATASQAQVQFSIGVGPQPPRPASTWSTCASENSFCRVPYPTTVRYGANGRYVALRVNAGVQCSNRVFGDPAVGLAKRCEFQTPRVATVARVTTPRFCANEGGFCGFSGTARVVYGIGSQVTSRVVSNGVACSNNVFGDPAPGQKKACYIAT